MAGAGTVVVFGGRIPPGDVVGDEGRVAPHSAYEVGAAVVLEALPEDVEPGHRRAAAALPYLAVPVQHRQLQPWVGPAISGGPHQTADARGAEIELSYDGGGGDGPPRLRGEYFGGQPAHLDVVLDAGEELVHSALGVGDGGGQVGHEVYAMAVDAGQPADEVYPVGLEGREVERAPVLPADEL
jgi:hypothetical protein